MKNLMIAVALEAACRAHRKETKSTYMLGRFYRENWFNYACPWDLWKEAIQNRTGR